MSLFNKSKKNDKVLNQDLNEIAEHPGMVFIVHLLMTEKCEMPDKQTMQNVMNKHFGDIDCFCHNEKTAGFAPKKYSVHYEKDNVDVPPQLMITGCFKIEQPVMDELSASQIWNCQNGLEILESCEYQVVATDMMASGLYYKDRAEMLVHYIEALAELYPSCKAFVFETSKKMITREAILNCSMPYEDRFIYYAVNVRFFNIQGTDDMLIDSIGMSTLFMPDLQYHFHGIDPNAVVNHAYNLLSYIYENENPIKSNDHIDGLDGDVMSRDIQWDLQYEDSLIQPIREVIDVNMGKYASGNR